MSKGTSSGLLDEARAQSVFKHAILDSYIIRFAIMTVSKLQNKRVVLVDGFAGRGRYPDRKPASGEHLLIAAQKSKNSAQVEVVLVEKEHKDFEQLANVTAEYQARGVIAEALPGDVQNHLHAVLRRAAGVPLFLFLDPCGANLPAIVMKNILAGSRRSLWPRTEALLNISADLTRRAAGAVRKELHDHGAIARMNTMCGGDWWQQIALDAHATSRDGTWETAAESVVNEYARRLGQAAHMIPVVVPVRRRAHHQPVYHLVFLTRAGHGLWVFGDALAAARQKWLQVLGPDDEEAEGMLFNQVEGQIEHEQEQGVKLVKENMLDLVARRGRVKLVDHTLAVFGGSYGQLPEKFVRRAARELNKAGKIQLDSGPKHPRDWEIWL